MSKHVHDKSHSASERRKFERVDLKQDDQVVVLDTNGKQVGVVRQIGRGGFMMEPQKPFRDDGKLHHLVMHEPQEDIRPQFSARVLYADSHLVGFAFAELEPDAAVEIGIIIGKYYEAAHHE